MRKNIIIILFFLIFTLVFNYRLVGGLLLNRNPSKIAANDNVIVEFVTEISYQNLKEFKNPFTPTDRFLYPFEINYSLSDTSISNFLFFLLFRPFLSQDLYLILDLNISFNSRILSLYKTCYYFNVRYLNLFFFLELCLKRWMFIPVR